MLVYMTDRFYNPRDEGRIPYNDPVHQLRLGNPEKVRRSGRSTRDSMKILVTGGAGFIGSAFVRWRSRRPAGTSSISIS